MGEYFQTIDVYLQILYAAQKAEDQKLVEMIRDRIKQHARQLAAADPSGRVIYVPFQPGQPTPSPAEPQPVPCWPRNPIYQALAIVGIYGYSVLFYLLVRA